MTISFLPALCIYPNSFSFLSDSPFEGEWKAAVFCAGVLAVVFTALLILPRRYPSAVGRVLLGVVSVAALGAASLALYAGRHAAQGLPCYAAPGLHPSASEVERASAIYQALSVVDRLAVFTCIATTLLTLTAVVWLTLIVRTPGEQAPA